MLKSCALLHVNQIDLFLFAALRLIIMKGIVNTYFDIKRCGFFTNVHHTVNSKSVSIVSDASTPSNGGKWELT